MRMGSQISSRRGRTWRTAGGAPASLVSASSAINGFRERLLASVAQPRPGRIGRDLVDVPPASIALDAAGTLDGDPQLRTLLKLHVRHDEEHRQVARVPAEQREL